MNCRDVQSLAGNYLDRELPDELADRIQRHLLRCAGCREDLDSQQRAIEILTATHQSPSPGEPFILSALGNLGRELDLIHRAPAAPGQLVLGIGSGISSQLQELVEGTTK